MLKPAVPSSRSTPYSRAGALVKPAINLATQGAQRIGEVTANSINLAKTTADKAIEYYQSNPAAAASLLGTAASFHPRTARVMGKYNSQLARQLARPVVQTGLAVGATSASSRRTFDENLQTASQLAGAAGHIGVNKIGSATGSLLSSSLSGGLNKIGSTFGGSVATNINKLKPNVNNGVNQVVDKYTSNVAESVWSPVTTEAAVTHGFVSNLPNGGTLGVQKALLTDLALSGKTPSPSFMEGVQSIKTQMNDGLSALNLGRPSIAPNSGPLVNSLVPPILPRVPVPNPI